MRVETEGHLGGNLAGGDPDTTFPDMWDWLVDVWEVKSVIDIGCGDGSSSLAHFLSRGVVATGIDGVPHTSDAIVTHDFTFGPYYPLREYDLAWSAEFVEHVQERYIPNFMWAFRTSRYALITHAEPGSPGWHHVNCRSADYWIGVFAAVGFEFDEVLTAQTRALASCNTRPFNHYRRSGLAFRRR
jgi:hypothetical protein